ncbi:MAG: hypothetical protein HRT69_00740 [Flavobacteriaceae bacterium]|nr:hypothetical protein [Flavobacteriaceae bacterium]
MFSEGMKALLKSDLQALAEKIQNLSENTSVSEMQNLAKELFEKLTVLKFVEENLDTQKVAEPIPEIIIEESVKEEETSIEDDFANSEILSTLDEDLFVSDEEMDEYLVESATEKMIDIVAQMEPETQQVDDMFEAVMAQPSVGKNDMETVTPTQRDVEVSSTKSASLNDRLKKGITIGLNDRIAFVKHLFNGSTEDFNRVISQLNTSSSELEALEFLNNMVKPEYNNWIGKEDYEQRLLSFLEGKFS